MKEGVKTMDKIKKSFVWVAARLEEPSTWAGGSLIAILVHMAFPGTIGNAIIAFGGSLGAFLAVVIPEKL